MGPPSLTIRPAQPRDAGTLLKLQLALDDESEFMLLDRGERADDPTEVRTRLQAIADGADHSFVLLAEHEGGLVGYIDVAVQPYARSRRTGYVVMGVVSDAQGKGIGKALLAEATQYGAGLGLRRLELTVMTYNHSAIGLYLASGFQVEGLRAASIDHGGIAVDEYYMGLLLSQESWEN